ncbi:MAG: hypothetical protein RIQ52_1465 [Pseudomonadota bacterium]|jgi:flagellar basal-body rod protein FlgB
MTINFKNALGIHPMALGFRERRTELLASNLANSDTPGFKARDIDFRGTLSAMREERMALSQTRPNHMSSIQHEPVDLMYRIPQQVSADGNTVDSEQEKMRFAENSVAYQGSIRFLDEKFGAMKLAIRGNN